MTKRVTKSFLERKSSVAVVNKYLKAAEDSGLDINQYIDGLLCRIETLSRARESMQGEILHKQEEIDELKRNSAE